MAIKRGREYFTYCTHIENGDVVPRRIHRLEVKDAKGKTHILTGKKLPDLIVTNAGDGHKGAHTGYVLLGKEPAQRKAKTKVDRPDDQWPSVRDFLQIAIGFLAFSMADYLLVMFG